MKRFISALSSLCLAATSIVPVFENAINIVPVTAADSDMTFDMVVEGADGSSFDASTGKNVYEVPSGTETFTVAWKVKNDPGTAGMQMHFDFGGLEFTKRKAGDAYEVGVQWNKTKYSYVFAQDQELKAADGSVISYFTFNVPSTDGSYEIKLKDSDEPNIVRPLLDENPDTKFNFNGLVVKVGDVKETEAPKTTKAPDTTQGNTNVEKPDPKTGTVQYDMIARGKDNGFNGTYNTIDAEPGEEITVDWTVKNDPGTAGMQIYFDFGDLVFKKRKAGDAYEVGVQWNKNNYGYVFAADESMKAADGAVISTFTFTVPETPGTYNIKLNESDKPNIVRPLLDEDDDIPFNFYGLSVTVIGDSTTKTTEALTTTKATDGLSTTKVTQGNTNVEKPEPKKGTVQYDMIAQGKTNGFDGANNTVTVAPGEQFTVDWTVKNDPGTAGMQIYFDFDDLTFNKRKAGDAYEVGVQWNKNNYGYVFAADESMTAADGAVISSFTFTAPEKEGTYTIKLNESDKPNIVRPLLDEDADIPYIFYGLSVTVGDEETGEQTTKTTDKPKPVAGTVHYEFTADGAKAGSKNNTVTVKPNTQLTVNWIVSNDPGTAGMQMHFDFDGLELSKRKAGDAYEVSVQWNKDKLAYVWGQEEELKAADGSIVSSFVFNIPDEEKTFTIGVTDKNGENIIRPLLDEEDDIPFEFVGLEIVVSDEEETTTSATTTEKQVETTEDQTTTTTAVETEDTEKVTNAETTLKTEANVPAGKVNWKIATVECKQNETVKVPVTVSDDEGTAGFTIEFEYNDALALEEIEWGDAYTGDYEKNENDNFVVWADKEGNDQKAADDAVAFTLVFKVSADAAGKLPVKFVSMDVTNTSGNGLTVTKENGAVIVPDPVIPAGKTNWTIGSETVKLGSVKEVTIPVTVSDDDGTAGFTVSFKLDETLVENLKSVTKGDAYNNGEYEINDKGVNVVWADNDSDNQKGSGTVINFTFTVPDKAGTYPIEFDELEVVNTSGQKLDVTKTNGKLVVEDDTPAGKANWEIARKELEEGGVEVTLPVTVTGDEGTAGYVVVFELDKAIDPSTLRVTADKGYVGETIINNDQLTVVWSSDDGEDQKADGVVLNLTMMAPEAPGTYPVKFVSIEAVNTSGKELDITKTDGAIIVWERATETNNDTTTIETTTTTTADSTTEESAGTTTDGSTTSAPETTVDTQVDTSVDTNETTVSTTADTTVDTTEKGEDTSTSVNPTTTAQIVEGESNWKIGKGEGYIGDEIPVPVTVTGDSGTAGFVVEYTFDPSLTLKDIKWADGYKGEPLVNVDGKIVVWVSGDCENESADGTVMTLVFVGTKTGEFDVDFAQLDVCDTNGADVKVNKTAGLVIIKEKDIETTTEATETTTEPGETTLDTAVETTVSETTTTEEEEVSKTGAHGTDETTEPAESTTAGNGTDVTTTSGNGTEETTTSGNGSDVTTTSGNGTEAPATTTSGNGTEETTTSGNGTEETTTSGNDVTTTSGNGTEETTTSGNGTEEITTSGNGTEEITTSGNGTEETTTSGNGTEETTTSGNGSDVTTTSGNGTEETTTSGNGTEETTTSGNGSDVTTSSGNGSDVTTTETTTSETTTVTTTTAPKPEIAIYDIGEVVGVAGGTVKVPVKVVLDPGTNGLTMEFKLADGFKVTGMEWGNAYPAADAVEWNAETYTVVWADPEGTLTAAESGSTVLTLIVSIPADAKTETEYPVQFNKDVLSAMGANDLEHLVNKSLDGWIMVTETEDLVLGVGEDAVFAGETANVPVNVLFDKGAASFEFDIVQPEGMELGVVTFDAEFQKNGTFTASGSHVVWTRNADSTFVPDPAHNILSAGVLVPATAKVGEYKMTLSNVSAKNANGDPMACEVVDGKVIVKEEVKTFLVNDFDVEFTAPERENYWSHDTRKFGDGKNGTNDGLVGLKAIATIYSYAVNEKTNHFVDENGEDLLDAKGNALVYDPNGKLPVTKDMAVKVDKNVDLTSFVRAKYAEVKHPVTGETISLDTPEGLWMNEVNALIAEGKGDDISKVHPKNKYEIEFYYYQDENSEIKLGNGTDPVLMGTKDIFIGVKGDINLDNTISIEDAKMALDFHVAVHQTNLYYQLNEDPVLDRRPSETSNEQGLPHYLGNVCYKGDEEPLLDLRDVKAILDYFVAGQTHLEQSWEKYAGYDFPDEFYPGY